MLRLIALLCLLIALTSPARAWQADAALKDRVAQLVEKLDDPKAEERDKAQDALVKLGPRILTMLPQPAKSDSAERKDRLTKIRAALAEEQEKINYDASTLSIDGQAVRLSEAVKQLQAKSENPITDLREAMGQDVTNPTLDLDIKDRPFFEALDVVARKAGVVPYFYTGDGTIGLLSDGGAGPGLPDYIGKEPFEPLVAYSGPFRIMFKQILIQRNLQDGNATANAQLDIAWEPRIRPMLLSLKAEDVEIVDDLGNPIAPAVTAESGSVVLRHENPIVEANINMDAPDREAKRLARFKVKAEVTVPAAVRTFRFPSLAKKESTQRSGELAVTLEDTEVEEDTWKVRVKVEMPGDGPVFETFRQGLFNNRLWLQRADGSKFEHNGGFNQYGAGGGILGFEYLFVDAPGKPADYQFVYETPGKVITIPLEFEFKDVPLP